MTKLVYKTLIKGEEAEGLCIFTSIFVQKIIEKPLIGKILEPSHSNVSHETTFCELIMKSLTFSRLHLFRSYHSQPRHCPPHLYRIPENL